IRPESPAQRRLHAEHREETGGDEKTERPFGRAVTDDVELAWRVAFEPLEDRRGLPADDLFRRQAAAAGASRPIHVEHVDETVGKRERCRSEQRLVDDGEYGRG